MAEYQNIFTQVQLAARDGHGRRRCRAASGSTGRPGSPTGSACIGDAQIGPIYLGFPASPR